MCTDFDKTGINRKVMHCTIRWYKEKLMFLNNYISLLLFTYKN